MLHQHKVILLSGVFISWLVLTSLALFNFAGEYYGEFAADTNWQSPAQSAFSLSALGIAVGQSIQVVHVREDNCICNSRAALHQQQFSNLYDLPKQQQFERNVRQIAAAGLRLPATPAVLIFNGGTLLYAGPYATGPLCSVSDSLIAPILRQQITLPATWFNAEAKACRCVVKKLT